MRTTTEYVEAVPVPERGVPEAVNRIEACTARLLDQLSELRTRLSSVLTEPDGKCTAATPTGPGLSPLAGALHERAAEIEDASARVLYLIEAVDL